MNCWPQSKNNILVAAHRGWMAKYPENTLIAFSEAIKLGVDQLETDVRVTKDGYLVLMHDPTVDRTTNGTGKVSDFTFEEIRKLKVINENSDVVGQIPTLTEFMDLVKDHPTITIDIELKEYPDPGREAIAFDVCDRVLKIVDDYNFVDRCIINSISATLHDYIYKKFPNKYKHHVFYPRMYGAHDIDPFSYAYCTCIFGIMNGEVTVEEVKELHERTKVRIWAGAYANNEENIDIAIQMGAEFITCNNPDEVIAILKKKNLHK